MQIGHDLLCTVSLPGHDLPFPECVRDLGFYPSILDWYQGARHSYEWYNLADNPGYEEVRRELVHYIPKNQR
jgi:hypothetical protein